MARDFSLISDKFNTYFKDRKIGIGNSIPTSGDYKSGDIIIKENQVAGESIGWICVTAGNPGTWTEIMGGGNTNTEALLPAGGKTNDILYKSSDSDFDVEWRSLSSRVIVNVSSNDGSSVIGQELIVKNVGTNTTSNYPVNSNVVQIELPFGVIHEISVSSREGYLEPNAVELIVNIGDNPSINLVYVKDEVDVTVNVSVDVGGLVTGQTLKVKRINDGNTTEHMLTGNSIVLKLRSNSQYELTLNDLEGALTPDKQTITTPSIGDNSKVVNFVYKKNIIYGFDIDESNSNPETAVTYTDGAVGFKPIRGNNGATDYGSWLDTFLLQNIKPCVVKDRAVQYYLNPNDYNKKVDGSSADITSGNDGDVMIEFQPTFYKMWKEGNIVKFRLSKYKQEGFVQYAFVDEVSKTEIKPMYVGAYNGCNVDSKLKSLSGKTPYVNHTVSDGRTAAAANGGYHLTHSKRTYVNMILTLVCKSRDMQTAIGLGRTASSNSNAINTGTMNTKGMFWGNNNGVDGCKVFGIEHWWGNIYTFMDGLCINNGVYYYQNIGPYGDSISNKTSAGNAPSTGYIKNVKGSSELGLLGTDGNGSSTTYYPDYQYTNNSGYKICCIGGRWSSATYAGPFCSYLYDAASTSISDIGSRLSL